METWIEIEEISMTDSEEEKLIKFLGRLAPRDFTRILDRIPGATGHVPDNAPHPERVAALVGYARSSAGLRMERLALVVNSINFTDRKRITDDDTGEGPTSQQESALPSYMTLVF